MNSSKTYVVLLVSAMALVPVVGQTKSPQQPPPVSASLAIKSTPASDELVRAAKDYSAEKKSFDDALLKARASLEQEGQAVQKQLQDLQKQMNDQLAADKKYKPMLDKMKDLQRQSNDIQAGAQQRFNQAAGPISAKMNSDKALVDGLIPIVKKENALPDSATFDPISQTWKDVPK